MTALTERLPIGRIICTTSTQWDDVIDCTTSTQWDDVIDFGGDYTTFTERIVT